VTGKRIVLFANTDWYLFNFRRSLALELVRAGNHVLLVSPPGEYGERLRALGLRWEPLAMERRSLNPFREVAVLARLVRLLRRERPHLVHAFTIKCAVYASVATRLARVRARVNSITGMGYVFSSHDLKARLLRPGVKLLMRTILDGRGARVILQNPDDVATFEEKRIVDPERIRLIRGSGVDCSRFLPQAADLRVPGPVRVLLAARILWDKGIAEYVDASRQLRAQGRTVRFLLAGMPDPGNPATVPVADLEAWQAQGLVEWLGHVDDMPGLLRSADIMVLPSYREGLPKSLIEAAACCLPLVTTDVPGCREVVEDGVDGLLVPARDATALATAIARLVDDPVQAHALGQAARLKALTRFDERAVNAATMTVYDELLRHA
jgi:glycosyltransferase involved in cell wall biosynthesis